MKKIPKRGKPVAKRIPIRTDSASLIGALEGKIKIKGDIFSTVPDHSLRV